MKVFNINFGRSEKSTKQMEDKINAILLEGKFKSATQVESPTTGRLYFSIFLDQGSTPDTVVKVFREISNNEMNQKLNAFLDGSPEVKAITQSVSSSSNTVITCMFCKKQK